MKLVYSTGGREQYFKATGVGDCTVRAIVLATGKDYLEVYNELHTLSKELMKGKKPKHKLSPRNGVANSVTKTYMENLGWKWVPTMGIGTGCKVKMTTNDLKDKGNIIVRLSKHVANVKDGVLYDTYDCTRNGTRCVYGYWKPNN